MGTLFLVSTPIGNLEDLSDRAKRVLSEVPLIAAEDTRTSRILIKHFQITTPLTSYHDHNEAAKTANLLEHLSDQDLALISDAGTPGINDPGFKLVRAAQEAGHRVVPIPGPSAPIAALSVSGLPADQFLYLGYLPRKKSARQQKLAEVSSLPWTLIFLETPHRLLKALDDIEQVLGDRPMALARELTKLHEEVLQGPVSQIKEEFSDREPKGEITLVIAGRAGDQKWTREEVIQHLVYARGKAESGPGQLAKEVASLSGWSRKEIYDLMQALEAKED